MKMHSSELGNKLWAISLCLPLGSNESTISACPYRNTHTHTHTHTPLPGQKCFLSLFPTWDAESASILGSQVYPGCPSYAAGRWPGLEAQGSQIYRKKMQLGKEGKLYKWAFKSCANSLRGSEGVEGKAWDFTWNRKRNPHPPANTHSPMVLTRKKSPRCCH